MKATKTFAPLMVAMLAVFCDAKMPTKRLRLLNLVPGSGQAILGADVCMDVTRLLVNMTNENAKILPDYELQVEFRDENLGFNAARHTINFARSFDDSNSDVLPAPIILGPLYSGGCKSIGPTLPHLNMVASSSLCTAPVLSRRSKLYKNLYLNLLTGQFIAIAELLFIRQVGQWTKFAMLTNAASAADYDTAFFLFETALQNGFEVPWFTMVVEQTLDNGTLESLKAIDARIIIVYSSSDRLTMKFLCMAHDFGLTGPRYVFLINYIIYSDPLKWPAVFLPGCQKTTLFEQLRQTFWVGPTLRQADSTIRSEWGFNQDEFDEIFGKWNNQFKGGDYAFRFAYHDYVLKAIYALDDADRRLKSRFNSSLADYSLKPEVVANVVNESLLRVNRSGLRVGRLTYNSENGMVATDSQVIVQWAPQQGDQNVQYVKLRSAERVNYQMENYFITKGPKEIAWIDNKPRDERNFATSTLEISNRLTIGISTSAAVLAASSIAIGIFAQIRVKTSTLTTISLTLSLLGIDLASALFAQNVQHSSFQNGRIFVLVTSVDWLVGLFVGLAFWLCKCTEISKGKQVKKKTQLRTVPGSAIPEKVLIAVPEKGQGYVALIGTSNVLVFAVLTAVWIAVHGFTCETTVLKQYYEVASDIQLSILMNICHSPFFLEWSLFMIMFPIVEMIIAVFMLYRLAKRISQAGKKPADLHLLTMFNLVNAASILATMILILFALGHSQVQQNLAIAFAALVLSIIVNATWFVQILRSQ